MLLAGKKPNKLATGRTRHMPDPTRKFTRKSPRPRGSPMAAVEVARRLELDFNSRAL